MEKRTTRDIIPLMRSRKIFDMPNEYIKSNIRCITTCSHIFIIIELIYNEVKARSKKKKKKMGNGEIYQFNIM